VADVEIVGALGLESQHVRWHVRAATRARAARLDSMERELTALERGVLEFVLDGLTLACGDVLRAQIPYARVVDGQPTLPTYLHLAVTSRIPPADCPDGKVPVEVVVESRPGDVTGFILVWARAGYLSAVEHAWVTAEMPAEFPRPEWLRRWDSTTDRT